MRILIVEDNVDLAQTIARAIEQMDHAVDQVDNGELAVEVLATQEYDLVILDLNLPGMDGLQVLRQYRARNTTTPVLILTARRDLEDRVAGLDLGADDYLAKPFDLQEVEARVRALLRRTGTTTAPMMTAGPLEFDTVTREARLNGAALDLTPRERGVLEILLRNNQRVVSKEKIADHLYSFDSEASVNSVELYVHRLRKKIDAPDLNIRTVRGLGYMLEY